MNRICTICARGGSKGVKNKNIRELLGRPLIAHSILQAKQSGLFTCIAVSSDSDLILAIAKEWGADFLVKRPVKLATDVAAKLPAVKHCVEKIELETNRNFDTIVDLDATSPLRNIDDIRDAVQLLEENNISNVITGMPSRRSPYFNLVELDEKGIAKLSKPLNNPVVRRQDSPKCYDMNASIYVWNRNSFYNNNSIFNEDTHLYIMPEERSIDIDNEIDFEFVEFLANKRKKLL